MKTLMLLLTGLLLAAVPAQAATNKKKDPKKEAREKLKAAKDKQREAIKDFMEPKDKNRDGSISRDEFLADEDDKEQAGKRFDEANKNGDRALSKSEIADMIGANDEVDKVKQQERDKKKKKK